MMSLLHNITSPTRRSASAGRSLRRHESPARPVDHPVADSIPVRTPLKIFVTVGTELPFDRLVNVVDEWAERNGCVDSVLAQIGEHGTVPKHIRSIRFIDKTHFDQIFDSAEVIVSHAGMGTILSALDRQRRLLVMPRRAALGEHRNDHQITTTNRLSALDRVHVAIDEEELERRLDDLDSVLAKSQIDHFASASLIQALRGFIYSD